jgi:phospholipase/carboxylesterase
LEIEMALLPVLELTTHQSPTASVIWLHGLGADGHDFVPIVKELYLPPSMAVRFVFPHAPMQPVSINNGMVMRAWYDIATENLEGKPDNKGVLQSTLAINELIALEVTRGIAHNRIILAGFSQGGAIALTAGTRYPESLGGVMALSTYLPMPEELAAQASRANQHIPILMVHGEQDSVIPLALAKASFGTLTAQGYAVQWHQYPMAHSVCSEEVGVISAWLQKLLK